MKPSLQYFRYVVAISRQFLISQTGRAGTDDEDRELERALSQLVSNYARMTAAEYINHDEKWDCIDFHL